MLIWSMFCSTVISVKESMSSTMISAMESIHTCLYVVDNDVKSCYSVCQVKKSLIILN